MCEWIGVENATMPLENLNHVLVLTRDLEATRDVDVDVLGLEDGCRPPFPFNGHWIYRGDRAVAQVAERRDCLDKRTRARRLRGLHHWPDLSHCLRCLRARGHDRDARATRHRRPPSQRCRTSTCTGSSSTTQRRWHRVDRSCTRRSGGEAIRLGRSGDHGLGTRPATAACAVRSEWAEFATSVQVNEKRRRL